MAKKTQSSKDHVCNKDIEASTVRLVQDGSSRVVSTKTALDLAESQGLDLILVSDKEDIPICKIIDYGKFKYQQSKNHKIKKSKPDKEVRFRVVTDQRDIDIKVNRALKFLCKGHNVSFTMQFRKGREMALIKNGAKVMQDILDGIESYVKVEQNIRTDGRRVSVRVSPKEHEKCPACDGYEDTEYEDTEL